MRLDKACVLISFLHKQLPCPACFHNTAILPGFLALTLRQTRYMRSGSLVRSSISSMPAAVASMASPALSAASVRVAPMSRSNPTQPGRHSKRHYHLPVFARAILLKPWTNSSHKVGVTTLFHLNGIHVKREGRCMSDAHGVHSHAH